MARHLLSDLAIRKAKPGAKPYRIADGDNLYVNIQPSGVKSFQFRYTFDGKSQTASFGQYPTVTLTEARQKADDARKLAGAGKHLTIEKRLAKVRMAAAVADTFEAVASEWQQWAGNKKRWSEDYKQEVEASLRNHLRALFPVPIGDVVAPIAGPLLEEVERRAPLMRPKVATRLSAIIDRAVMRGLLVANPLPATMIRGGSPGERRNYPAVTDVVELGKILRDARAIDSSRGVQRAHELVVFTVKRISEVVGAEWSEFDLGRGEWTIPRRRMKRKEKRRRDHVVPLPPRLLSKLREWQEDDGPSARWVCPAPRRPGKPVTREAVEKHYSRTLGLANVHSPHSWRTAFSTICNDAGKPPDVIEAQLDHATGDDTETAYDRAERLERRGELMDWYERRLLAARDGAEVVQLKRARGTADRATRATPRKAHMM